MKPFNSLQFRNILLALTGSASLLFLGITFYPQEFFKWHQYSANSTRLQPSVREESKISRSEWKLPEVAVAIDPNDKEALISAGCFVDPTTYKPKMSFNQPSPDSANDAWDHLYQTCSPMTREYLRGCPIPNAYHTIFIDGMNFSFHHYVSLKSVHSILKPFAMYIHGYSFPTENLLFQKAVKAFNLTLVPARKAEKAFHIDLQTDEQSDVLRLEINALYGGIYSDLDVFWLKSMTHEEPSLLRGQYEMVLAPRFNKTNHRTSLTNVILVNKRCARFIQDWYKFYTLLADAPRKDFPTVLPQTMWQSLASENSTASDLVHVEVERLQQPDVTLKQFIHTPKGIKSWKWGKSIACNLFYDKYQKNHTFDDIKVVNNPIGRMARYILWGDKTKAFDMNKDYFL